MNRKYFLIFEGDIKINLFNKVLKDGGEKILIFNIISSPE